MDYTVKTRQEIAQNRLVSPKEQKIIYEKLGNPIKQPHRFAMR